MLTNIKLSNEELFDLLNGKSITKNEYGNGGEILNSVNISFSTGLNKAEELNLFKRIINISILKLFDISGIQELKELLNGYLQKLKD